MFAVDFPRGSRQDSRNMSTPLQSASTAMIDPRLCVLPSEIRAKAEQIITKTCISYTDWQKLSQDGRRLSPAEMPPSDWHLHPGEHPYVRRDGQLSQVEGIWPNAWGEEATEEWLKLLDTRKVADAAMFYHGWQFRVHAQVCHTLDYCPVVSLMVRRVIKDLPRGLILPSVFKEHLRSPNGFIAISGDTGSGKSTTLTRLLIDMPDDGRHVIMYENPPEFRHHSKPNTLIRQFERGLDFHDLELALGEQVLRKDAEILVPTELREDGALRAAVAAAGAGHLVISTMHLSTAPGVVGRVMGDANIGHVANVSANLRTVLCQKLVAVNGGGRMALFEHLSIDDTVRSIIARTEPTSEGVSRTMMALEAQVREQGVTRGSFSFEHSLCAMVERRRIDKTRAFELSSRREWFEANYDAIRVQNEKCNGVTGIMRLYDGPAS